ncbi:hypothetical protein OLMES_3298 [Oleiphilus messinensis]|uniref:HEAT repeat domain-containing protein n=1 Tax=Oleiphilus messinensis TaxID=141451 RepID=A0A1Y0IAZ8_9GAMM|nr:hypothetical protein [Oleiphilus messinensis]ARU57339.1 hypothetical protein OLMES_3298 [Oleiphilus messinensis]
MEYLISRLPDQTALHELSTELKKMGQEDSFQVVMAILKSNDRRVRFSGLALAAKVIRGKENFLKLLDVGLSRKDESEIRYWLTTISNAIGVKNVINHIKLLALKQPDIVVFVWYQLVPFVREQASEEVENVRQIEFVLNNVIENEFPELQDFWERIRGSVSYSN